jgi:hypothetical protein
VKPGDTIWHLINVSRLYDMSLSGKYVIQISRPIRRLNGASSERAVPTGKLVFKELAVTITDAAICSGVPQEPLHGAWEPFPAISDQK